MKKDRPKRLIPALAFLKHWMIDRYGFLAVGGLFIAYKSACISYRAGTEGNLQDLAEVFGASALLAPFLWSALVRFFWQEDKNWTVIGVCLVAGLTFSFTDAWTNLQTVGTDRRDNIVQTVNHNGNRNNQTTKLSENRELRDSLVATRKKLAEQHGGWILTSSYEGLTHNLKTLKLDRRQGCARSNAATGNCWKYTQQCTQTDGPITTAYCGEVDVLKTRIGGILRFNKIGERIEALDKVLAATTDTVAKTKEKVSLVRTGAEFVAGGFWTLSPDEESVQLADRGISLWYALFLTVAASFLMAIRQFCLEADRVETYGVDREHLHVSRHHGLEMDEKSPEPSHSGHTSQSMPQGDTVTDQRPVTAPASPEVRTKMVHVGRLALKDIKRDVVEAALAKVLQRRQEATA